MYYKINILYIYIILYITTTTTSCILYIADKLAPRKNIDIKR